MVNDKFKLFVRSPIEPSHLGEVIGREFLLWVGPQRDVAQRDRLVAQVLASKSGFGDGTVVMRDCDFDFMEVHARRSLELEGHHWYGVDQLTLDGEVLPERSRYLFAPTSVSTTGNALELRGSMRLYGLFENDVHGRVHPVSIKFGKIPEYKESGLDIGCEVY